MPAISAAKNTSLILHGVGLIVIYSMYGVLQEAIMKKHTYGPDNQHFTSSSLLIVFNRVFSVCVGLAILFYKSKQMPQAGSFASRLKPASPMVAYASVAACNFLSTTCQYEALKYVSYTTQSLAKCSKMIPVLVVGALVYKKQAKQKEWVAASVIALGCATYLFSNPPPSKHAAPAADDASFWTGLIGAGFLCGYLFFDGLVSTTQERVFGKNPSSADPFGPESPVLDQMIWTNTFAGVIALAVALLSNATGTLMPNVVLLMTSPALLWDVCVFSAASALGLIVLLNTIASFGALTSSLIMTIRQFLSILINAVVFGSISSVGLDGWVGVGWVASGIWIKMNRAYDEKKPPKVTTHTLGSEEELERLVNGEAIHDDPLPAPLEQQPSRARLMIMQYAVPCAIPVGLAAVVFPFMPAAAVPAALSSFSGGSLSQIVTGASNSDDGDIALPAAAADFVEDDLYNSDLTAVPVVDSSDDASSEPSDGFDYAAELAAAEEAEEQAQEAEAEEVAEEIQELAEELAELEGSGEPSEYVAEAEAEVEQELEALEEVAESLGGGEDEWSGEKARLRRRRVLIR